MLPSGDQSSKHLDPSAPHRAPALLLLSSTESSPAPGSTAASTASEPGTPATPGKVTGVMVSGGVFKLPRARSAFSPPQARKF